MSNKKIMTWVVDRFENGNAVLRSGDDQLIVSKTQLSGEIKEGDILTAEFYPLKDEKKRKESVARALLDEILGKV